MTVPADILSRPPTVIKSSDSRLPPPGYRLAAIEGLDDVIIFVDTQLRIRTWNETAERLHRRSAVDVIGRPILEFVAPGSRLDESKLFARSLAGERIERHDTIFLRSDGAGFPISVTMAPVGDGTGNIAGVVLLGTDVGARQRLQAELLQTRRIETNNLIAGGTAHEFNNILTTILALADLTARALPVDSALRKDQEAIRQQATDGARLVRHLLAFNGRQVVRTEVASLGTIVRELEPLLQRIVTERVLLAVTATDDRRFVEVDRAHLEIVLLELASNARDAMQAGGTLTIGTRSVSVAKGDAGTVGEPGDYVEITVHDTGVGFDPVTQDRLVEPLFTTKRDGRPGLGLTMVDGVVHKHGGTLTFASEPGQGTSVRMLFPASKAVVEGQHVPMQTVDHRGGNETVLVVDDESAVRTVICRSLRWEGYEVLEAKNGEDAMLVAERHDAPIHLLVTDIMMPVMGGAELFQSLRRWYPKMRFLFISGYTKDSIPPNTLEDSVSAGAGFLPKPFTIAQLSAEVSRIAAMPRPHAPVPI